MSTDLKPDVGVQEYEYGFHDPTDEYVFISRKGLDAEIIGQISEMKNEPGWMRDFRLQALEIFFQKPMPTWGGDISGIDFQNIYYYVRASDRQECRAYRFIRQDRRTSWCDSRALHRQSLTALAALP